MMLIFVLICITVVIKGFVPGKFDQKFIKSSKYCYSTRLQIKRSNSSPPPAQKNPSFDSIFPGASDGRSKFRPKAKKYPAAKAKPTSKTTATKGGKKEDPNDFLRKMSIEELENYMDSIHGIKKKKASPSTTPAAAAPLSTASKSSASVTYQDDEEDDYDDDYDDGDYDEDDEEVNHNKGGKKQQQPKQQQQQEGDDNKDDDDIEETDDLSVYTANKKVVGFDRSYYSPSPVSSSSATTKPATNKAAPTKATSVTTTTAKLNSKDGITTNRLMKDSPSKGKSVAPLPVIKTSSRSAISSSNNRRSNEEEYEDDGEEEEYDDGEGDDESAYDRNYNDDVTSAADDDEDEQEDEDHDDDQSSVGERNWQKMLLQKAAAAGPTKTALGPTSLAATTASRSAKPAPAPGSAANNKGSSPSVSYNDQAVNNVVAGKLGLAPSAVMVPAVTTNYRLRPPPPPDPKRLAREAKKAREKAKQDYMIEKKREEDLLRDKAKFFAFQFTTPGGKAGSASAASAAVAASKVQPAKKREEAEEDDDEGEEYDGDEENVFIDDEELLSEAPFSLTSSPASPSSSSSSASATADKLFDISSTFPSLGITQPQLLANLQALFRTPITDVTSTTTPTLLQHPPTRIQSLAIPLLLSQIQKHTSYHQPSSSMQEDYPQGIILQAQTGSGKTLAFLLPLIQLLDPSSTKVQALIVAPSRELVTQIGKVANALFTGSSSMSSSNTNSFRPKAIPGTGPTGIRIVTMIGGANAKNQMKQLRELRPQLVIATPGRLAEMIFQYEALSLGNVKMIILDEVDNLLRENFADEITTIIEASPMVTSLHPKKQKQFRESFYMKNPSQLMAEKAALQAATQAANKAKEEEAEEEDDEENQMIELEDHVDDLINAVDDDDRVGSHQQQGQPFSTKKRPRTLLCLASATANTDDRVFKFADKYCNTHLGATTAAAILPSGGGSNVAGKEKKGWVLAALPQASILPPTVTHALLSVPRMKALEMLKRFLFAKPAISHALIFVNDPHRVEIIVQKLLEMNIIAAPLHGDSSKDDRKEVMARLADGRLKFVVTTEIAARGLDIPNLSHVINFELPTDAPHYVHRAGRCGRAGREGLVMNFATPDTKFVIRRFAKKLGTKMYDCEIREGQVYLKEP